MHELTDAVLVVLARADNSEAFRLLLERYQPMAFAIALHQISHTETAQDLVQEAMLQNLPLARSGHVSGNSGLDAR